MAIDVPPQAGSAATSIQARKQLAAAHRLAVRDGLNEGSWNHFSLSDPSDPTAIFLSPSYTHWSQVTASSLERLGPDLEASEQDAALWTGYRIHYPLHLARPDAACVLHVHSPHIVALSMLGVELNRAEQNALLFHGKVAYTGEYDGLGTKGLEQGEEFARVLGSDKSVLILKNHGAVVVGPSVGHAYTNLYKLERAARVQLLAMSTGLRLQEVDLDRLERERIVEPGEDFRVAHFEAMCRVLDVEDPGYAE